MEIILICNEKGGAGKSATACCLGNCLTALGYRVLIVDTDPSGNLSAATLPEDPKYVLYDVLRGDCELDEAICKTDICDILPTIKDIGKKPLRKKGRPIIQDRKNLGELFGNLNGTEDSEKFLLWLLRDEEINLAARYDFILIDTPPAANLIITNGLIAADSVIVPCEPNAASADGLKMIQASIQETQDRYGNSVAIDGLVFTRYTDDTRTRREHIAAIISKAHDLNLYMYQTKFVVSPSIETSMNECRPILDYIYAGRGVDDAMNFTLEFLSKRNLAPKANFPGVFQDGNGKWIFCKNGSRYYTFSVINNKAYTESKWFRLDMLENAEFRSQLSKTVFFNPNEMEAYLTEQGIPVASDADSQNKT